MSCQAARGSSAESGCLFRSRILKIWQEMLRLRQRCASRALLPSLTRRATYVLVAGSSHILIKEMVCIARFSCRSPPRFSRCLLARPEETGIGATPAKDAKAASERNRPGCGQLTRI